MVSGAMDPRRGVDYRALLRDLTIAYRATEGLGAAAQAAAINAVLAKHNATADDVQYLRARARSRRRVELDGLSRRLGAVIEHREQEHEEDEATAEAVDRFLRGLGGAPPNPE